MPPPSAPQKVELLPFNSASRQAKSSIACLPAENFKPAAGFHYQSKKIAECLIEFGSLFYYNRTVRDILTQLSVNPRLYISLAHQLKQQIKWLIASTQLKSGDSLPSLRLLTFDPRRVTTAAASIRSNIGGEIVASLSTPFYHSFLQGLSDKSDKNQTLLYPCNTQDDPLEAHRYFLQLTAKQVDGVTILFFLLYW